MADLSPARVQALKDRPLRDFGYGFVGVSMSMDERDDLLAALEAQGQTIARLEQEKAEAESTFTSFAEHHAATESALAAKDAELAEVTAQRDKWLGLFNRSEQFQDGPTKRAEKAEAELARLTAERTWRPISEAPRDGTCVLLWWPFWCKARPVVGSFGYKGIQQWFAAESLEGDGDEPTHWQPLPDPPVAADAPKE